MLSLISFFLILNYFNSDCMTDVRQNLAAPRTVGKHDSNSYLNDLLNNTQTAVVDQIKSVLNNLQVNLLNNTQD